MHIKNVMVTGGGGFLGKAIVKKLIKKNYNVTSFSRNFYPELEKMGVEQIQGNLINKTAVKKAFKGQDAIFHVASKVGVWGDFEKFYQVNVTGTKNVIFSCFENKVDQLIYTSSPSVVFDEYDKENIDETAPYSKNYMAPYPETKAMAEQSVKSAAEQGLSAIILRPHAIWGPEDNHLIPILIKRANKLKRIGQKKCLMDSIYVDNAADAHIMASQKLFENPLLSGNIYFISQDEPIPIWEMVNALLDAADLPPIKGHVSRRTAYIAGFIFEFLYNLFNIKKDPPITKMVVVELSTSHWFNISKAKKELGYHPKISTKEGLKILKQWFAEMETKRDE